MSGTSTADRILGAQSRLCEELAAAIAAARAAGAPKAKIEDLEAQEQAARKRYQELAVDLPGGQGLRGLGLTNRRRPWWRFW
jgi:hypothetical protein